MKKADMLINYPVSVTPAFQKKIDSCLQVLNQCLICDTASILLIKSVRSMELHNFFSMSYQQSLILLRQYWHSQRLYNIYVRNCVAQYCFMVGQFWRKYRSHCDIMAAVKYSCKTISLGISLTQNNWIRFQPSLAPLFALIQNFLT